MGSRSNRDDKSPAARRREGPQGPPLPPSAYEDIPWLPPFEPDSLEYDPGELEVMWYWFRGLFRRRSQDRAA